MRELNPVARSEYLLECGFFGTDTFPPHYKLGNVGNDGRHETTDLISP